MSLLTELRRSFRALLRVPQFSLPVLLVSALGIGATAALFGTLRTVLFTELPFERPERILSLRWIEPTHPDWSMPASWPLFQDLRERVTQVEAIEGLNSQRMNLGGSGDPEMVGVGLATPGLFRVFAVRPLLGTLAWEPGADRGAILTEGLWERRFGRDARILEKSLTLNGVSHPILGVLPGKVHIGNHGLFVPLVPAPHQKEARGDRFLPLYGRLRPGTTLAQAQTELDAIAKALGQAHPGAQDATTRILAEGYQDLGRKAHRTLSLLVLLASGLLAAMTLVNLANQFLNRALARTEEAALRLALGAGLSRATRPRILEVLLLSAGGALLGLGVAHLGLVLLRPLVSPAFQAARPLSLDWGLLGFTSSAALGVGLALGGIPGLLLARFDLAGFLKAGSRGVAGQGFRRLRAGLVALQVALALVLLAAFGTLSGKLQSLRRVDLGLNPEGVAVFTCDTRARTEDEAAKADRTAQNLLARLRALPGVESAGSIAMLPVEEFGWNSLPQLRKEPLKEGTWVEVRTGTPGLFRAFGIRLLRGRDFEEADLRPRAEPIAIVSESMARTCWPGQDPLGQEFSQDGTVWHRVVGVVNDVRNAGPSSEEHQMTMYFPSPTGMATTTFVVRFASGLALPLAALRQAAREEAPTWAVKGVRPMTQVVKESLEDQRILVKLLGFAGVLALLLALAGLHGVLGYQVLLRAREFGIRTALGATRAQILGLVLRDGLSLSAVGSILGLGGALALGRLAGSLLADANPSEPWSLAAATLALLAGTALASLLPALRAARADPAVALRSE